MGHTKRNTHPRKGKYLNRDERIQIEVLLRQKYRPSQIARLLGRDVRTIQRERRRGAVTHLDTELRTSVVYNADRAHDLHELNATAKGPQLKIGANHTMVEFIRFHIAENRYSPEVVAHLMKQSALEDDVSPKTIYSYIDMGLIPGVSNETLWEKRKRLKRRCRKRIRPRKKAVAPGHGIDNRPNDVGRREEFGHWEIDLVVGGKGAKKHVLLTLVERKSRKMLIRKLPNRTQAAVLKALNAIERSMGAEGFRVVFKTITADNGSEFLDTTSLEQSAFGKNKRTHVYYAHPYSSWERGSNENANRLLRRFIPKGSDISIFSKTSILAIQEWINSYPRKILGFKTAEESYLLEAAA
jgi:IS30 family transposase